MSKTKIKSFFASVISTSKNCHEYSYGSKNDLKSILVQCAHDLHSMGYKVSHVKGIKHKHIYKLIEHWHKEGLNPGTIKNRMSKLRKLDSILCGRIGIQKENKHYKLEKRSYSSLITKAIEMPDLNKYKDKYIKLSIEGQRLFGLRREESIKIIITDAVFMDRLILKPSWTKGGVGRDLPIENIQQLDWIKRVKDTVGKGKALIPDKDTYRKQLVRYTTETAKNNDKNLHGLRHAYAQQRYREITAIIDPKKIGLKCPHESGIARNKLSEDDLYIDTKARHIISRELGHTRISIMTVYLG